jgi:hypothetical protein
MRVELSSVGNPNLGQNPYKSKWGAEMDRIVEVSTFEEASFECMKFIHENYLSSSNWSGGDILNEDGLKIAYVSYNGKVWEESESRTEIQINREVVINMVVELNKK